MWRKIFTKPVMWFSILLSLALWLGESLFHYLIFDPNHPFELIPSDTNELWMRLSICGMVIIFGGYIQHQTTKKRAIQEEKLRTLKATMHTVEDRIGNSLLSIKYLLTDAENNHRINRASSKEITDLIDNTMAELRQIRKLDVVTEKRFSDNTFYLELDKNHKLHSN
jgi:carboxypeptidase C (cathepsin A)